MAALTEWILGHRRYWLDEYCNIVVLKHSWFVVLSGGCGSSEWTNQNVALVFSAFYKRPLHILHFFLLHSFHISNVSDFINFHRFSGFPLIVFSFLFFSVLLSVRFFSYLNFFTCWFNIFHTCRCSAERHRCFTALSSSTFKYILFYVGGSCARV